MRKYFLKCLPKYCVLSEELLIQTKATFAKAKMALKITNKL